MKSKFKDGSISRSYFADALNTQPRVKRSMAFSIEVESAEKLRLPLFNILRNIKDSIHDTVIDRGFVMVRVGDFGVTGAQGDGSVDGLSQIP